MDPHVRAARLARMFKTARRYYDQGMDGAYRHMVRKIALCMAGVIEP